MINSFWCILLSICNSLDYSVVTDLGEFFNEHSCHKSWPIINAFEFYLSLFKTWMSKDYKFVDKPYLAHILYVLNQWLELFCRVLYDRLITCYTHNHWWVIVQWLVMACSPDYKYWIWAFQWDTKMVWFKK